VIGFESNWFVSEIITQIEYGRTAKLWNGCWSNFVVEEMQCNKENKIFEPKIVS
jgi:hypothetical protein